jgi:RNA polymerase sigma factor (TIGR02999 family)
MTFAVVYRSSHRLSAVITRRLLTPIRGQFMTASDSADVTRLLVEWSDGNREALDRLIPLVYDELWVLAGRYLRQERRDHTLQPTALIHEAFLKLVDQRRVRWQSRTHFFGIAARVMRRILVDHARSRSAAKRPPRASRVPIDDVDVVIEGSHEEVLALDHALVRLAAIDPRQERIVEMRFFAGLTIEETAAALSLSSDAVRREWSMAKAWLYRALSSVAPEASRQPHP